jgi:predicted RNA-binding protein Jag
MGVLLTLDVNREDMGKIIGKDGGTAKALRIILRVVGMKHNARVNLKINEPVGGKRAPDIKRTPEEAASIYAE